MLIYFDTNIWIYALEDHPTFGAPARKVLARAQAGRHRILGSLFVLGELLVAPTYQGNEFAMASYRRLFSSGQVGLLPYPAAAVHSYVKLRAYDRLKAVDALHLATAAAADVDILVTQDVRLLSLGSLGTLRMMDLENTLALL